MPFSIGVIRKAFSASWIGRSNDARRVRPEFTVIAALGRERHAIAERPQQIGRPRPERDHDMARARSRHPTAPRASRSPSGAIDLISDCADLAAGACKHPRIGLDDVARRIHRRGFGVQQADAVDRQDVRLERGDRLAVEQFALDAVFGERRLIRLRRGDDCRCARLSASRSRGCDCPRPPCTIHSRCSFSDALISPCRAAARGLRLRRARTRQKARDPVGVSQAPSRIPAQRGMTVGEIFRQRFPTARAG